MSNLNIRQPCPFKVPSEKAPFRYQGKCYQEGDVIMMHPDDYARICGVQTPVESKSDNPWPKWELICGVPRPARGNIQVIEAEEFICIDIDAFECRPDILFLNYKGDCILTQCDQEPVPEEMLDHTDWNGPMMNERTFLLGEDPITCKKPGKIYVYNPGPNPVVLSSVLYQV